MPERAIGRRGQEQHHGRGHDVVLEARLGDLLGAQAAADAVVAFEDEDLLALLAQQGRGDQRVDAAADDDVVSAHGAHPRRIRKGRRGCPRRLDWTYLATSASARIGEPVPLTNLQRRGDQDRALGRQLVEMAEAGETIAAGLVHQVMRREGRVHAAGRTGIGADRFLAPAHDLLGDEIFDRFGGRARRMRAVLVGVEEGLVEPLRLYQSVRITHPAVLLDRAVLGLPFLDALDGEQEVRVGGGIRPEQSMTLTGPTKACGGMRVGVAVRQVLAGDPVTAARRNGCRYARRAPASSRPRTGPLAS